MKSFIAMRRPSPALIVSFIALFVALSGTGYAVSKVGSKQLRKNAVTSAKIRKNAVTATKIRKNAVTTEKIKADAVTGSKLLESSLRKVPDADKLDGQDSSAFESSSRFHRVGTFSLGNGEARTFLTVGPFSFTAKCSINDGGTDTATVVIATTRDRSAFDGTAGLFRSDFGPGTIESSRRFAEAVQNTTGQSMISDQDGGLAASPDGVQVVTNLWAGVNLFGQTGRCQFGGLAQSV